jgi:hypothetical protein
MNVEGWIMIGGGVPSADRSRAAEEIDDAGSRVSSLNLCFRPPMIHCLSAIVDDECSWNLTCKTGIENAPIHFLTALWTRPETRNHVA